MSDIANFPFAALVGQQEMRTALLLAVINPLAGASRVAPCSFRTKGRTSRTKVTKLDTGLPGSPMK